MTTSPFTQALQVEVATLQTQHPILAGALDKAYTLVAGGGVFPLPDGHTAHVQSQSDPTVSHLVNGTCDCTATQYHAAPCAHRLAFRVYQRTVERLTVDPEERWEPVPGDISSSDVTPLPEGPHGIDPRHIVTIQGKPFVKYAGLLELAHQRGLVALTAAWTYNDAELSLGHAVATFQDGRRFEESGDASPANCSGKVALHFRRVALTRAKARVLRDALGVDLVAVEELD